MDVIVELNLDELAAAAAVGARRNIEALRSKKLVFADDDNRLWQNHIEGAAAEIAVSKARDRYWSGCGPQSRYDAAGSQVRAILQEHHCLILREHDADDDVYILVYAKAPYYRCLGWIYGYEGKRDEFYVDDPNPYWRVPQGVLRPFPQ